MTLEFQTFRVAWRNLWRNKVRTSVTLAGMAFTTAMLITTNALMQGFLVHMVRNATNLAAGEVQVHASGYLRDRSIYKRVEQPEAIIRAARAAGAQASQRLFGSGLAALGTKSVGVWLWGVEPEEEAATFQIAGRLEKGKFLRATPARGIVLGKKLAHSLHAEVGSEVVIVIQAADGSLGNELYTVTGILKSAGESIDRAGALIHAQDFRELFVMPTGIHEIAINSRGKVPAETLASSMIRAAGADEVKTWRELLPMLSDMVNLMDVAIYFFGGIFFLAAGLGVLNTMLMAALERVPEYGVIKALGATPGRMLADVLAEAFLLGMASTLAGAGLGIWWGWLLETKGIDTSALTGTISFGDLAFDPVWHGMLTAKTVIWPVVITWTMCLAASLYPALVAIWQDPARAIQR